MKERPQTKGKLYVNSASVLLLLVTIVFFCMMIKAYFDGEFDSVASMQEYMAQFGTFAPVVLMFFQALQVVLPVLPGFLGCAVGAVLFGPVVGFLCNYIGISTGSIAAFLLARKFGKPLVQLLFPEDKYQKWSDWASKSKSYTALLFAAMVLPLFPDDFLCYFTGLSQMTAKKFVWIIILGKPWCILAYSIGFSMIH